MRRNTPEFTATARTSEIVPEALGTISADMIPKNFITCKDYIRYHTVDKAIKEYKSHRRVY